QVLLFYYKQKTSYDISRDWSSDVCSSDLSSRMMMSAFSASSSRVSTWVRPSIAASVGSDPGPMPNIDRPRVMWSSMIIRSATHRSEERRVGEENRRGC